MFGLDTAIIVGILTVLGGLLLKGLDHFLNRGSRMSQKEKDEREDFRTTIATLKQDMADQRKEMKEEIAAYKEEVDELRKEVDDWKLKYYELREDMIGDLANKRNNDGTDGHS